MKSFSKPPPPIISQCPLWLAFIKSLDQSCIESTGHHHRHPNNHHRHVATPTYIQPSIYLSTLHKQIQAIASQPATTGNGAGDYGDDDDDRRTTSSKCASVLQFSHTVFSRTERNVGSDTSVCDYRTASLAFIIYLTPAAAAVEVSLATTGRRAQRRTEPWPVKLISKEIGG